MPSLDTLSPDQRAVLELVLRRGRSYDDIARLLAIDRAAVRARALDAFDAIGPETGISPESRALITDYLLGQLPGRVAEQIRERLAGLPYERAWARLVASELESLAADPLPEIPEPSHARATAPSEAGRTAAEDQSPAAGEPSKRQRALGRPPRLSDRPSSRRAGAIMLGVGVLVVVVVVLVLAFVLGGGSGSKHSSGVASKTQIVAQVNLDPPSGSSSAAKGVGLVVKDGNAYGMIIEAQHVAPNSHNAYAAWLYNSATDSSRLGFVNPAVGKSGVLRVGTALPANAGHYRELLLTLETQTAPKTPGPVVLEGALSGLPASG